GAERVPGPTARGRTASGHRLAAEAPVGARLLALVALFAGCGAPMRAPPDASGPPRDGPAPRPAWMPHPVVDAMPADAETSIEAVAAYVAARGPERRERIRALHDGVADRIVYSGDASRSVAGDDRALAEQAFLTRRGVCRHFAALLAELGRAAGEDIPVVEG